MGMVCIPSRFLVSLWVDGVATAHGYTWTTIRRGGFTHQKIPEK